MLAPPSRSRTSPSLIALWAASIALGYALDLLLPLPFVPLQFPPIATGTIFILIGFGIVALALHEMRDFNAPSEETGPAIPTLVTGGVYRFSRNPMSIGLGLALLGFAVAIDSLWVVATLIPYVWIAARHVADEEAELASTYGELYDEYCEDVRRWL